MLRRTLALWLSVAAIIAAAPRKSQNVILITADGLRWQEIFSGIDPLLMNEKSAGMSEAAGLRRELWRDSAEARREALLPFFWKEFAPRGIVLGNVSKASSVRVTNAYRVSYPGYSEILTGRAQDDVIRGNEKIRNPSPTILEFLRQRFSLPESKVAEFASWDTFAFIGEHTPGSILINAGYQPWTGAASLRMKQLSELQFDARTPWPEARHDYVTFEMALEYMRQVQPRVLHIALDETDDWAHQHRYDRVLEAIEYFDRALKKLWEIVGSSPAYRGRTTIVLTSDHGRGSTLQDYNGHGANVAGADHIWLAIVGPDTPARGEVSPSDEYQQRDIAPTILELLGIQHESYAGVRGRPIAVAIR